jgi:hypothetical protein
MTPAGVHLAAKLGMAKRCVRLGSHPSGPIYAFPSPYLNIKGVSYLRNMGRVVGAVRNIARGVQHGSYTGAFFCFAARIRGGARIGQR